MTTDRPLSETGGPTAESFAGETGGPRPTVRPAGARDAIPSDGVPLGQEPYVKPRDLRELRKKNRS
jgi:hypothetical protein